MPPMNDRLLLLMERKGWTVITLAGRSRVAYHTVRKAMNGVDVAERTWRNLAAGLGVAYEALTGNVPLDVALLDNDTRALLDQYTLLPESRRLLVRRLIEELLRP